MKPNRTTAEQIAWLKSGLQACRNLEIESIAYNDLDSAAHFRLRQKQIKKELDQLKTRNIL